MIQQLNKKKTDLFRWWVSCHWEKECVMAHIHHLFYCCNTTCKNEVIIVTNLWSLESFRLETGQLMVKDRAMDDPVLPPPPPSVSLINAHKHEDIWGWRSGRCANLRGWWWKTAVREGRCLRVNTHMTAIFMQVAAPHIQTQCSHMKGGKP